MGHKVYRVVNKPSTVLGVDYRYFLVALSLSSLTLGLVHGKLLRLVVAVGFVLAAKLISAKDPALPFVYVRRWTMAKTFDPGKI